MPTTASPEAPAKAGASAKPSQPRGPLLPWLGKRLALVVTVAGLAFVVLAFRPAWQSITHLTGSTNAEFVASRCHQPNPLVWECSGVRSGTGVSLTLANDGHRLTPGSRLAVRVPEVGTGSSNAYLTGLPADAGAALFLGAVWFVISLFSLGYKRPKMSGVALAAGTPLLAIALIAIRY